MTPPRFIIPGAVVMVTMRCTHRLFRLTPSRHVNLILEYLLAYTAAKYQVGLVSLVVMANHVHAIMVDHEGRLPDMLQTLNSLTARALNQVRGHRGSVFERNNVHIKYLEDEDAIFIALAYIAANPVAAGCVERGADYPGLRTKPKDIGRAGKLIERPTCLFGGHANYRGKLPRFVLLRYELPPSFKPGDRGWFVNVAETAVHLAEDRARKRNAARGVTYLGRARCWDADPNLKGATPERRGLGSGPDPILATSDYAREQARLRLLTFFSLYDESKLEWQHGDHEIEFPWGTWLVVARHAARRAPNPLAPDSASASPPFPLFTA